MTNFSDRVVEETHLIFVKLFSENRAIYEVKLKNTVEPERPQMTV